MWQYVEVRAPFMDRNRMGRRDISARIHLLGYVHRACVCVCVSARTPYVSCISLLLLPSCRPDDGTPHSPDWRFSNTTVEEEAAPVLNLIMSGAPESDIDALVSRLLSQMNISRSELPHPWVSDPDNEVAELNFEEELKIAQQHIQRSVHLHPLLFTKTSKSHGSSSSDESSGYLSEDSSPFSSNGSALSPPQFDEVRANPFLPSAHEEGLLPSDFHDEPKCCTDSILDSFSPMNQQYSMDMVSSSLPHTLLSRHDSVENALRSVLESQAMPL